MKVLLYQDMSVMFFRVYMLLVVLEFTFADPAMLVIGCGHLDLYLSFDQRDVTSKKFIIFQLSFET